MKASEPSRWVGLPVFKLEVDRRGREVQISGKVISYSPSSARFLLLYEDGSSDGVPVNEIGDHVPLKLQLPLKKRRKKRKAEICRERTKATPVKRSKIAQHDPPSTQQPEKVQSKKLAIVTRFVQDTLCSLTAALDISDEKQRVLLAALDNRKEQPLAALERYDEEGGLEALNEKLRSCVREIKDKRHKGKENKDSHAVERPCRDEKEKSVPRRPFASLRTSSRCDQHLRDLMSGKVTGVFSSKPTLPKEPLAPCKEEPKVNDFQCVRPNTTATSPAVVDLTDLSEEEEDIGRRLHFGRNSAIFYDNKDPLDVFQLQVTRERLKRSKPKKSSLKNKKSESFGRLSM